MMQIPAPSVGRLTDASTTPDFSIDPTVLRCRSDIGQSSESGTGSAKTDHARKSALNESLRAAMNVFADPRFHGCTLRALRGLGMCRKSQRRQRRLVKVILRRWVRMRSAHSSACVAGA
jgi:hypothetical protein